MAEKDGQRRMLFDLQSGRRRGVVRVIYAFLALLMGGGLIFFGVGSGAGGGLLEGLGIGGESGSTSATSALDDQAERVEQRLRANPEDEALLLALSRARITAGSTLLETDPETGVSIVSPEARAEFEKGLQAWDEYVKSAEGEPNAIVAQMAARAHFNLAETSGTLSEIEASIESAAAAQALAAKSQPSVNTLSTLAIFEYFNGNFAAADAAVKQAAKSAPSKSTAKQVEKQLAAYRKRGKEWQKQRQKLAKEQSKRGREELEGGFEGLGGGASLTP